MSKALALRATALPIRPSPTTPSVAPLTSCPSRLVATHSLPHLPERTKASPSTTRLRVARISAIVRSAVAASSTPGVFETATPRAAQATTSIES